MLLAFSRVVKVFTELRANMRVVADINANTKNRLGWSAHSISASRAVKTGAAPTATTAAVKTSAALSATTAAVKTSAAHGLGLRQSYCNLCFGNLYSLAMIEADSACQPCTKSTAGENEFYGFTPIF